MNYQNIKYLLSDSPTIKIFRSEHAPLVLSFFHNQFKKRGIFTVSYTEMKEDLVDYLEQLQDGGYGDDLPNSRYSS